LPLIADSDAKLLHRIGAAAARLGNGETDHPKRRLLLQLLLGLVIFGFLLATVASQEEKLREEAVRFEPIWLLSAIPILLGFFVLEALGWDLILRELGHRLRPAYVQRAWGQSLLARYVPGNVLFVLGRVLLAEREGVPRRTTLASMVYEAVLKIAAAITFSTYYVIDHPDLQGEPTRWLVLAVVPLAVLALHPAIFRPMANALLHAFGRGQLDAAVPLRGVLALLAYYCGLLAAFGIGVFLIASSVYGLDISQLSLIAGAQALGLLASVVAGILPGGLGARDGAFAWALDSGLGASFAVGAAIAVAVRFVVTLVELIYVGIVTLVVRYDRRRTGSAASARRRPGVGTKPAIVKGAGVIRARGSLGGG
jgi:hypothetical protein